MIHTEITMKIIGDHPHTGELCHPRGETKYSITQEVILGKEMYPVKLVDCPHGTDGCYVERKNLEMISAPKKAMGEK
jgi:hypothetical protein